MAPIRKPIVVWAQKELILLSVEFSLTSGRVWHAWSKHSTFTRDLFPFSHVAVLVPNDMRYHSAAFPTVRAFTASVSSTHCLSSWHLLLNYLGELQPSLTFGWNLPLGSKNKQKKTSRQTPQSYKPYFLKKQIKIQLQCCRQQQNHTVTKITRFLKQSPQLFRKQQVSHVRGSASTLSHRQRLLVLKSQAQGTRAPGHGSAGERDMWEQLYATCQPWALDNALLQRRRAILAARPLLWQPISTVTPAAGLGFLCLQVLATPSTETYQRAPLLPTYQGP